MLRARLLCLALPVALVVAGVAACAIERDIERDTGVHPEGFAEKGAAEFHGAFLRESGFALADCRQCHGDDYGGGAVGVSCESAGCHSKGVEWCGTCHAGNAPPKPVTGAHVTHTFDCASCHEVPKDVRADGHPDGAVDVALSGLGASGGATPVWDGEDRRCAGTYCHGAESPVWESPAGPLECGSCHGAPPESHARFKGTKPPDGCATCHPPHDDARHLDGELDFLEPACNACHGESASGAPPPALNGAVSPLSRGVGAHARHLDETLSDRIGRPVSCDDCHDVPESTLAEGHLDGSAPADVRFFDGTYDAKSVSCVVGCHWDKDPGPMWTDTTGAERACDACHGFPPTETRLGNPHPQVEASQSACLACHHFEPATHVDGHVDFLP